MRKAVYVVVAIICFVLVPLPSAYNARGHSIPTWLTIVGILFGVGGVVVDVWYRKGKEKQRRGSFG